MDECMHTVHVNRLNAIFVLSGANLARWVAFIFYALLFAVSSQNFSLPSFSYVNDSFLNCCTIANKLKYEYNHSIVRSITLSVFSLLSWFVSVLDTVSSLLFKASSTLWWCPCWKTYSHTKLLPLQHFLILGGSLGPCCLLWRTF